MKWWQDLSVSKKLYSVVGVLALFIAMELFTLYFAMTTLSAVRAFVGGEGLWSKAQKSGIYNLQKFALTRDPRYYEAYLEYMKVPLGDHKARIELEKPEINIDAIRDGFVQGQNHPDDVEKMVKLVRRFHEVPYLARAIDRWREGDRLIHELMNVSENLKAEMDLGRHANSAEITAILNQITALDVKLTIIENEFSYTLGEASRWLEGILMLLLICAVVTIEGTGLFLTITFSRGLNRGLKELNEAATAIGEGDFSRRVQVRSADELGQLAGALNAMTVNLENQVKSRRDAEHASEVKNRFLANMSHEIRTPLNAILGFAELMNSPSATQEDRDKYSAIVRRTGANLLTIINDILDIAKVEAQEIEIEYSKFSVEELIFDLEQILKPRCDAKDIVLKFQKKGNISKYIQSDMARLRQILLNVIGNAIKFTSFGSITVEYGVEGRQIIFIVSDTGIGISSDQEDRLFKPFSQADSSVNKKYGGTGLGLSISQGLARRLGGDLGLLRSHVSKGSSFFLKIPYLPAESSDTKVVAPIPASSTFPTPNLENLKVLVCEDSIDNQLLTRVYLSKTGAEIEIAENGKEGVARAENDRYDLILMDIQMPVMDGFTATKQMRKLGIKTPIIALTGFAMKQDQEKCFEAGCDDFLAKPFNRQSLLSCILKHVPS